FEWEAYERKKENLRNEIKVDKDNSISLAKKIIQTLVAQDLNIEDFSGGNVGSIAKFFHEVVKFYRDERDTFPLPGNEEKALENFNKGASAKGKKRDADIQVLLSKLLESRLELIAKHINIERNKKILDALLPLKVNADIQNKLKDIETENDLVLLSKFNVLINENLKSEPSSFIYEKVGTQFQHFFFDEFQDTSKMQWENFKPLRDNAIASDNTSFSLVGDPKQSIYRFRGGESQLMLDIISHTEEAAKEAEVINLEHNWRSAKYIVDFNNQLYYSISRGLEPIHEYIFGEAATQIPKSNINGRVRVNLLENDVKEIFYEEAVLKMRDDIQQCLDNGFELSDICILCRGNTDIFNFSNLLGQQLINYKGQEQYIKSISESGLTIGLSYTIKALIEFLNWKVNPNNYQFFIKMLYHLNHLGRIQIKDFTTEVLDILETKNFVEINNKLKSNYNLDLSSDHILNLNLYNYIEYFLHNFSIENKEVDFLLNFLEMLFNYTQNAGATIKDFLKYWNEEGINQSIQASESIDAIKMMTIHKSKGLEFPIVFLPMRNENKDSKFSNWFDLNNNDELKKVNITGFNKKLLDYDQEMSAFNIDNEYKNKIDRFCLQYVATTRAVEQLYLYLEKPNKSANHLEIIDYINAKRPSNNNEEHDFFDLYPIEESDLKKQKHKTKNIVEKLSITALKGENSQNNNIQIATPSKNYQERVAKVRIGIFVHEILSKIKSNLDLEQVLEKYELEGVFTSEERINIEQRIFEIINSEDYSHYFIPGLKVISERDVMISKNGETKVLRPDRLIDTEHGFIIIDFKTGKKKEEHEKQIETYRLAFEQLGKKVLKCVLIYV
uniref:UvrD-helicase domain-containing protein n=1 Tax=Soonwooa sp. TaxID=1938592 RepID=UPI0028ABDC24